MSKTILTIEDFASGITYDETESTTNGFNDLSNIDIKSQLGIARLSRYFTGSTSNPAKPRNSMVEYSFIPDISNTGSNQALFQDSLVSTGDIYYYDTYTFNSTKLYTGSISCPKYAEIEMFNNRLIFSSNVSTLGSISFWTGGNNFSIKMNGTTTIRVEPPLSNFAFQPLLKNLEGGTLYFYAGGIWNQIGITTVTPDADPRTGSTVILASSYTTGTYEGYAVNINSTDIKRDDGTFLNLSNKNPRFTSVYRPMINFNSKLYIGDGDMISNIDSTMSSYSTTQAAGAISVGSDYVVKQFEQIGGYMYILADKVNQNFNNNFSFIGTKFTTSRLYIWDGTSDGFQNIIECGTHCYSIKAIENRIYAVLQSSNQDGVLFTYFNGSDFPTQAKFQVPFADCPLNSISYDRGRFYVAVNGYDIAGNFQSSAMFAYSSYAIETPSVSKEYEVVDTAIKFKIDGIDYIKNGVTPLLLIYDNNSGTSTSYIRYRTNTLFQTTGTIQTQKYEITVNQFGQLVKGIQVNCKEVMPANTTITLKYRGDEETLWTTLPVTITSANQNQIIWGVNRRYRKIQFQVILTSDNNNTPKLIKIMLY